MKKDKYSLEHLIKVFSIHHKIALAHDKEQKLRWETEYNTPYPHETAEDFSISAALKHICEEIKYLKEKIK